MNVIMPETGNYGSLSVTVDDEVSDCPPNADCGWPEPGTLVRLKFYSVDLQDPWEVWRPSNPGVHTLKLAKEAPDTGALTFGDSVTIQVGTEVPSLQILSGTSLQLLSIFVSDKHTIEASTDLMDWASLALPANTTALSLDPKVSPTQFFRLVRR